MVIIDETTNRKKENKTDLCFMLGLVLFELREELHEMRSPT